jgi:hypothetical protein
VHLYVKHHTSRCLLDDGPDDRQATALCCEHIDLIGALPHIAEETFNRIGRLNMPMHGLRELVKREGLLFFLGQTSYGFWIALAVFGFEGGQLDQRLRFVGLIPDASEFGSDLSTLPSGDGIQHIALFMRPASTDEVLPKTTPRPLLIVHHARR